MVLDNSALNNLGHQCDQMTPGTEYVIKMTQQELDEHFRKTIQKTGCDIKQGKNGKIIIVKKQDEEDPLAGWGDMSDINKFKRQVHNRAEQAKNRAEQAQNRAEQAQNRAEQAQNRAEQAQKELALVIYGDEIATNLSNLLDFNQSKKEVLKILDRTFLDANNLKQGHFYKTTQDEINLRIQELEQIKSHYKSDNKIIKKINDIIKIFNKYNENH